MFWCHRNKISQLSPPPYYMCSFAKLIDLLPQKAALFSGSSFSPETSAATRKNKRKVDLLTCPHDANRCQLRNAFVPNSEFLPTFLHINNNIYNCIPCAFTFPYLGSNLIFFHLHLSLSSGCGTLKISLHLLLCVCIFILIGFP